MLEFVARFLCLLPIGRRQHASHVLRTRVFLRQALMRFSSAGDSARDTFDVSLSFPFSVSSLIIPSAAVAPLSNDFCLFCFSGLLHLQNLKRIVVRVHVTSTLVFLFFHRWLVFFFRFRVRVGRTSKDVSPGRSKLGDAISPLGGACFS